MSREGSASYRVRSYLAAQVSRGRTTIAWVWDVYDRDQQRALRLSGEEPAGKAGRDAWAAADDRGVAANRAGRPDRPLRHDQRNGAGGCAGRPAGAARPGPCGCERGAVSAFGRIQRRRAELQRPLTIKIAVPARVFAQENRLRRVASSGPSLISPRSSKTRQFRGYSDMLNVVSSGRGEKRRCRPRTARSSWSPAIPILRWRRKSPKGSTCRLTKAVVRRFADMEIFVEIQENVRGSDAFIIQSTSFPANDHLMELLIITDALRRSSARRITAVIPYFGYARQDRKSGSRTPISAKLVANLITHAGVDRVMTLDLHAGADPGLLRHPDRQSLRLAGDGARHQGTLRPRQCHGGVARRRRRGARPRPCQAHQHAAGDHRQAPRTRRRIRSDERDRRRRRLHLHPDRRHRRFRRHAGERRRCAARQRRQGRLRLHHPRRALRRRRRAHRRLHA